MSNITSLLWIKEVTKRREEKEEEMHKNARTQNWYKKKKRLVPTQKIIIKMRIGKQAS
jgi:hypothetical protein